MSVTASPEHVRSTSKLVGRETELRAVEALLGSHDGAGPAAVALEGDAGIGKSTIWVAAVAAARDRGLPVLASRPAQAERDLAYASLGDLLEGRLEQVLPVLAGPRRRALEAALLLTDDAAVPGAADPRAVGVAVRDALELLAAGGLVLAVDDLQWLDAASAAAVAFALRRLHRDVRLVWTRRLGEDGRAAVVEGALDPGRVERLRVGPLTLGAVHRVVQRRLQQPLSRRALVRLHEVSGGNPLYAIELARALGDGSAHDPTKPLPVPDGLEDLVSARLAGLAGPTREALALVAAQPRLTFADLERSGVGRDLLEEALAEQVVELEGQTVRFSHPLLASVLYGSLTPAARREVHRRLSEIVVETLPRARHLALAARAPDAALATSLEEAAAAAEAPIVAAELGEHALRLTPATEAAALDRRVLAAARAYLAAGEVEHGRRLLDGLAARVPAGASRAEVLMLLADFEAEDMRRAIPLLQEALQEAADAPILRARVHQRLSLIVRFSGGLVEAEAHARTALALAEEVDDATLRRAALAGLALIRFNRGEADAIALAEKAHALSGSGGDPGAVADAEFALAHVLVWSSQIEQARMMLEALTRHWRDRDERLTAFALWYLSLAELRAGRLARGRELADEARELSRLYARSDSEPPTTVLPQTLAAALVGDLGHARELGEEGVRLAELHGARVATPRAILGVVELWSGSPEEAVAHFAAAASVPGAADLTDPGMAWWRAEQVAALLEIGLRDQAVEVLDPWEAEARRLGREWVLAHACRCRGLVAGAQGEVESAVALLEEAAVRHEAAGDPFGRYRALLALGVARRRARQKRPAREAIEAAAAGFEAMGAAGWAATARGELGRIGGRTRAEGLTPAERRVAALVAEGRTNTDVATALFLAERTVASHLTRVYAKLGVRSRAQLARTLRQPDKDQTF